MPEALRKELLQYLEGLNNESREELIEMVGQTIYQNREVEDAT